MERVVRMEAAPHKARAGAAGPGLRQVERAERAQKRQR